MILRDDAVRLRNCLRNLTDGIGDGYAPLIEEGRRAVIETGYLDTPPEAQAEAGDLLHDIAWIVAREAPATTDDYAKAQRILAIIPRAAPADGLRERLLTSEPLRAVLRKHFDWTNGDYDSLCHWIADTLSSPAAPIEGVREIEGKITAGDSIDDILRIDIPFKDWIGGIRLGTKVRVILPFRSPAPPQGEAGT